MPQTLECERLCFADFELDTGRRALCRGGLNLRLAPKEYAVLACLVQQAGKAVSREYLMAEVWPDTVVGDTSLARCISVLRRHLETDAIEAVPKFGYRFTLPVRTDPPACSEFEELPRTVDDSSQRRMETAQSNDAENRIAKLRGRRWMWAALSASGAVLLLGALHPRPQRVPSWAKPSTTWLDPQTGLEWQRADNGVGQPRGRADLTRAEALAYCSALRLNHAVDWRLPTIAELQTLYDTTQSLPGLWGSYRPVYWHVKGNLALSGSETASDLTWLTDTTPAGDEQGYDFSFGGRNYNAVSFRADHRVLCVR